VAYGGLWFPAGGWLVPPRLCAALAANPAIEQLSAYRMKSLAASAPTWSWRATLLAACTVAIMLICRAVSSRIPGPIVAMLGVTIAAYLLKLPVETIGSRFGGIPSGLPHMVIPRWHAGLVHGLLGPAFTVAMLGAIESLLSAVVSDGMIGSRHRSSMELVAQGVANIITPMFGGIPATGAIARTATNVKAGGRTPIAGMTHAVVLLLITLFFGKLAGLIPLSVLAGILMLVAYRMSEWRVFVAELRGPRSDAAVLLTTFFLTLLIDLTVGIGVGMVLASFLFMRRMSEVTDVRHITDDLDDDGDELEDVDQISTRAVPAGIEVYEIDGPFFFGAAEKFKDVLAEVFRKPKVLIIRMRHVPAIDSTGLNVLRDLIRRTRHDRTLVLISELQSQPLLAMRRSGLLDEIGQDNVVGTIDLALAIGQQDLVGRPSTPINAAAV